MKEGKAECIYAHRFLKEADQLNFYEKLGRFQSLIALNKRASDEHGSYLAKLWVGRKNQP